MMRSSQSHKTVVMTELPVILSLSLSHPLSLSLTDRQAACFGARQDYVKLSLIFQSCPLDTTVRVDHLMYEGILHPVV